MATRYPKDDISNKRKSWTILQLDAIPAAWKGDSISDGKGLSGDIRVSDIDDGKGGIKQVVSIKFKYVFRLKGKGTTFYQCGTYPANDLATIRGNRDNAKMLVATGIDPRTQKVADKIEKQAAVDEVIAVATRASIQNLTVKALFNVWIVDGVKRKDGNKGLIQSFNKHVLPIIGKTPLKNLEHQHLSSLYKSIVATGKNRTSVIISKDITQMLAWAEKRKPYRELLIDGNPAALVNMTPILPYDYTNIRDRVLSVDEIKKLQSIFDDMKIAYRNAPSKYGTERPLKKEVQLAMWICLSTLSRIGELLMTEWRHIDFEKRMWHIPKENTKGMKDKLQEQDVYLSDFTLNQFEQLRELTGESKWVFPARYSDSHVCLKSASKQIGDRQVSFKQRTKKLKLRVESDSLVLGDKEWTPHDLRRTGATMMQELKITRDVINLCQNHVVGSKVDRSYLHYEYADEKREAWITLGNRIEAMLGANNVVQIKAA